MGKRKPKINPPGTPFPPDHPFAWPFPVGGARSASTAGASGNAAQPSSARRDGMDTDDAYLRFRLKLQQTLDGGQLSENDAQAGVKAGPRKEYGLNGAYEKAAEAVRRPLVPQRPPDLEDLAFEILRQARYKYSKRL